MFVRSWILALALTLCSRPSSPLVAPLAYDLTWSWTAGLGGELIFGRISALEIHPSGALLVLDAQLGQVVVLDPSGTRRVLSEARHQLDVTHLQVREDASAPFLGRWALMSDGAVVFVTHFSRYELALARTTDEGEPRRLDRALEPRVRSHEEIETLEQQFAEGIAAQASGMAMEFVPSEVDPLVSGVLRGPRGEIWVRRTQRAHAEPDASSPVACFDRHDSAGNPTGEVEFYGDVALANQLMIVSGEQVYVAVQPTSFDEEVEVHVSAFELHVR